MESLCSKCLEPPTTLTAYVLSVNTSGLGLEVIIATCPEEHQSLVPPQLITEDMDLGRAVEALQYYYATTKRRPRV